MVDSLERRQVLTIRSITLSNFNPGLNKIGQTVYYPLQYKRLLMEVGFKNVTERKYAGQYQNILSPFKSQHSDIQRSLF